MKFPRDASGVRHGPSRPRWPKSAELRSWGPLTPQKAGKMTATVGKLGRHDNRGKARILVMYRHALRVFEAIALRWDRINFDGGRIHVNHRKNGTPARTGRGP